MGEVTHLCNFGTPLYQGFRRIPNVAIPNAAIPNIAILNVVIPNEVVGGEDGVGLSTKETNPLLPSTDRSKSNRNTIIDVEKTVRTKVL